MDNNYNNNYGGYQNNYQYNNYDSNYDMPHDERKGAGFAIASFVLALVNIIPCCTCLSIVTVPLCIIFSIVSLVQRRKGKGFAITGIVLSVLAGILFAYYGYLIYKITPDYVYFIENQQQIVADYDRDGSIPERYEKYRDPKYDKYWEKNGYDSFDDFFGKFIEGYKSGLNSAGGGRSSADLSSKKTSDSTSDAALVFIPALT